MIKIADLNVEIVVRGRGLRTQDGDRARLSRRQGAVAGVARRSAVSGGRVGRGRCPGPIGVVVRRLRDEQRDNHRAERRVVEARVRAANARLELLDHDPARGGVSERVEDDGEANGAAVTQE